jgi:hypothetical protein
MQHALEESRIGLMRCQLRGLWRTSRQERSLKEGASSVLFFAALYASDDQLTRVMRLMVRI